MLAYDRYLARAVLLAVLTLAGMNHAVFAKTRPAWVEQPKSSDSIYLYVVGHAPNQSSAAAAREAAFQDALATLGTRVTLADGSPAPAALLRRAEILPGCIFIEEIRGGYAGWVQVGFPLAEQERLANVLPGAAATNAPPVVTADPQEQPKPVKPVPDEKPPEPERPPVGPGEGTMVGPAGGRVENQASGIALEIPAGALDRTVAIAIVPQTQYPPLFDPPLADEFKDAVRVGAAVDLGPSGTKFQKPVRVQWRLPDELRALVREKGARVEVGYYNGTIWQPFNDVCTNADGSVSFETTHFTVVLPVCILVRVAVGIVVTGIGTAGVLSYGATLCSHPERWITAKSPAILAHVKSGNVRLPDPQTLARGGSVSLGLGRGFEPYSYWVIPQIFFGNGEAMLTQRTACCQEATFFAASVLRASGDPRFQNFICVQGTAVDPATGKRDGHMWMELEIDGKIWVLDTAGVRDLKLMLKDDAYNLYQLQPARQFTDAANSVTRYVGLARPQPQTGGGAWIFDTIRFEKSKESETFVTEDDLSKTTGSYQFKAQGRDGFMSTTYDEKQVTVSKKTGEEGVTTVRKAVKVSWSFGQPMDRLTPGQKISVTGTLDNASSSNVTVSFEMDFMKSDVPLTHGYQNEVPFFKFEDQNWRVGARAPAFQGQAEVPEVGRMLFSPTNEAMAIRCKLGAGGLAAVYRIYRWAPPTGSNAPAK